MKKMNLSPAILMLFVLVSILACKKQADLETPEDNISIVGKWKSVQAFLGYFSGGDFKWHPITDNKSSLYTFNPDSTFFATNSLNG